MRIHGNLQIKRRSEIDQRPYKKYEPELREDFCHRCGYCGKSEAVTKKGFEIDHFIPQRVAPELKDNYHNLIYSCFTCNRKKGRKWPTESTQQSHNDTEGFVDPACDEYDLHLERDESGKIISRTPVGEYMRTKAFKFDKRPTQIIWKAMHIISLKNELRSKWNQLSDEEKQQYMAIDQELESLLTYIFDKKE